VQISVVVAIIKIKTLKAEVEEVSTALIISHGLLGPKAIVNSVRKRFNASGRKGMRLIFLKGSSK